MDKYKLLEEVERPNTSKTKLGKISKERKPAKIIELFRSTLCNIHFFNRTLINYEYILGLKVLSFCFCVVFLGSVLLNVYYIRNMTENKNVVHNGKKAK